MNTARHPLAVAGVALAIAACASNVCAADAAATVETAQASTTAQSPAQLQARRAVRDKETGKLRSPTEDEVKAMIDDERAARAARGQAEPTGTKTPLAIRQHASGMKSAVLGPEFLVTLKAQRDASGKIVTKHADPAHDHAVAQPKLPTE